MVKGIFVNLPVKNLDSSIAFFKSLGFTFNAQFTDETATCMVMSDTIYAMLLTEAKFKEFTPRNICDTSKDVEVLLAISLESREAVDTLVSKAVAAGGKTYSEPKDHGFMYQKAFHDLDGHAWEIFYMDPSFVQPT
ncbi:MULTISPECIES: VOC family protein [unclassified Chelatococcus]|uniref:VOC family protein n=1 Tax=unclassified Chelatococcus TaxID=2638111 RepID=UPI001BCC5682|nr:MULTISPECIES: VOC family protein [unclassified Chelatococcus]CAH1663414.1 VOC domain-containing protein [Hyphomicrobiales bacterium]MBS7741571.1 hypothetical protein [Chelatococcus sp. HY11]MBX3544410.1 hypothetical protein [Chelatococcus sp.]MCO5079067.1 hypothetical protein [Chelatococcus sp.]CAH1682253.1 VOC domain-containing protein [Hyphomicrobiales bacterium]